LVEGRKLILGGVVIPHPKGLEGHSDADVLMHAICDAVLGALGEADIGHFFSQYRPALARRGQQPLFEGSRAARKLPRGKDRQRGCHHRRQQPKLFPHISEMKVNIAEALGLNIRQVGIKATTNELLGFIGREEGIAAMAVASVDLPPVEVRS